MYKKFWMTLFRYKQYCTNNQGCTKEVILKFLFYNLAMWKCV